MLMFIGLIAFLLAGFFIRKGIVDIFRKKNVKKSFVIALASFVVLVTAIVIDPSDTTEVSNEEKIQNEEQLKKEKNQNPGSTQEKVSKEVAEKKDIRTEETNKDNSQESSGEQKDVPLAPKVINRGFEAKVTRVVDGDTIEILMNGKTEKVRMLLLDTPETKHPSKPIEPFGSEATSFAKEVLQGKIVGIEPGMEERDKYGRLLAYVWIGNKTYQEMILEKGLGVTAYLFNDLRMLEPFHKAQNIAKDKKIGVWSISGYAHVDHNHGFHYEESAATNTQIPAPATKPGQTHSTAESFANCTELRKVYPDGIDSNHPAYQKKMDRDGDQYACER